jgi:hypothetical protein
MTRRAGRDTWLYSNSRSGQRIQKTVAADKGRIEQPVSDFAQRMLVAPVPKIIHLGGETPKDGTVHVIRKFIPDYPASHQLKDPFDGLYSQGIALEPPLPPDRLLNLTEENTLHSGCLMAKAYDACGRGWEFEPKTGKKGNKALLESDMPEKYRAGMETITPDLTFGEMLYQAAWEMDAIGWSVWEAVRMPEMWAPRAYAPIGALYPIPSFTTRATIDPRRWVQIRAGRVRFFKKFGAKCEIDAETGQVYSWDNPQAMASITQPERLASELIIFKSYSPRSLWYGIPKWISCIPTIAELTAIREFNVSWFASGGQTDYLVHFKSENIETAKKMSADMRQQMQENQGRGHTNIVVAGTADTEMNVEKLGELLREGHFRFRRGDLAKEVLIAHTVPPYRVGWAEVGSGSGLAGNPATEMLGAYKYGAIEPIQNVIEDRLRMTLFDKDMGMDTGDFRLKLKPLELDDMTQELDRVIKLTDSAIMTPNQAREELGLDPVEKVKGKPKTGPDEKPAEQPVPEQQPKIGPDGQPLPPEPQPDGAPQYAQKAFGPDGQPLPAAEPKIGPDGQPLPPEPQAAGTRPGMDDAGANMNGPADTDEGQVEAMNTYYYKGAPLAAKPATPPQQLGPDGKPVNPFAPKPNPFEKAPTGPDGAPLPDPTQKAVDKTMEVITAFEKTLRDSLREQRGKGPVVGDAPAVLETAPSNRRASRRPRQQP